VRRGGGQRVGGALMTESVVLLKAGKNVPYVRCEVCAHYVRWLSVRGWCEACEREFRKLKEKTLGGGVPSEGSRAINQ
jgi:formate dehydrogenase maturation protein FdhE